MEQSPSRKGNSHSANHEIPRLLRKPKILYIAHHNQPTIPTLSQMNPVHNLRQYFPKIHSNIIFPSMSVSFKWSVLFSFSNQNISCISHLSNPCYSSRPSQTRYVVNNTGKITFVPMLLTEHYVMEAYWGFGGTCNKLVHFLLVSKALSADCYWLVVPLIFNGVTGRVIRRGKCRGW
jgi:hypothetical protein